MNKTGLNGKVSDFTVSYETIDDNVLNQVKLNSDIKDIYEF